MTGASSEVNLTITGGASLNNFFLPFSSFSGIALNNIGALEITIFAFDNVDTFVDTFAVIGPPTAGPPPVAPSASPTPGGGSEWYTFDDDDEQLSPCTTNNRRVTYFLADDQKIYYYFYGGFEASKGYFDDVDYKSVNSSSSLVVSFIFAIVAIFATF